MKNKMKQKKILLKTKRVADRQKNKKIANSDKCMIENTV